MNKKEAEEIIAKLQTEISDFPGVLWQAKGFLEGYAEAEKKYKDLARELLEALTESENYYVGTRNYGRLIKRAEEMLK